MKGIKNNELRIMVFALTFILYSSFVPHVLAADATSSADLQAKIDQIKAEIASKAAEIKKEVNQKIDNKAFAGRVASKEGGNITLSSTLPKVIITNDYTDFEYDKGLVQAINKDNFIVGLGDVDDKGNLVAKKVLKILPPKELTVTWGKIKSSSDSSIIVEKGAEDITIKITKNTDFQFGSEDGSVKDAEPNKALIVSGFENSDNSINARFIYIFKQGFIDLFKKAASNSATQSGKIRTEGPRSK